jgi:hypothetical protein
LWFETKGEDHDMETNERALGVKRFHEGPEPAYRVFLEGVTPEPVVLNRVHVGYMLGVIYGGDAAAWREVVDDVGRLDARPWLAPRQEAALRSLVPAWAEISGRCAVR